MQSWTFGGPATRPKATFRPPISIRFDGGALATSSVTLGAAGDTTRLRFVFEHLTATSGDLPYAPADGAWRFAARDPGQQAAVDAVTINKIETVMYYRCDPEGKAILEKAREAAARKLPNETGRSVSTTDTQASIPQP